MTWGDPRNHIKGKQVLKKNVVLLVRSVKHSFYAELPKILGYGKALIKTSEPRKPQPEKSGRIGSWRPCFIFQTAKPNSVP